MTTIPPKLAASMLSRGNYKPLARAAAQKSNARRLKVPGNAADSVRAFYETFRPRKMAIVLTRR